MVDLKRLLEKLGPASRRTLETAAGRAVAAGHAQVTADHLLATMAEEPDHDVQTILRHFGVPPGDVLAILQRRLEDLPGGGGSRPVFAAPLIATLRDAWLFASVDLGDTAVRTGAVFAAWLAATRHGDALQDRLAVIAPDTLRRGFREIVAPSRETADAAPAAGGGPDAGTGGAGGGAGSAVGGALARYAVDVTERARAGRIDPVFARDREIRQMVDILGRRRKNNPILVGDAGVGKTAVVEGLALKIVNGDVPDILAKVRLVSLDLGLLQAGAGARGEFENRLKQVIAEVTASPVPIVLFIDEAHTLIGAGGAAGMSDAANLLKPALARGELRTVAATTWAEYKRYFEKDPALARRFQPVKLDEPSPDDAVTIMRGLKDAYEAAHGVYIQDAAIAAAVRLSARYISGRQLPDKAVDVLDTACARVRLSQSGKPAPVEDAERRIATLEREHAARLRDGLMDAAAAPDAVAALAETLTGLRADLTALSERWQGERDLVARILERRAALAAAPDSERSAPAAELADLAARLATLQGRSPMVLPHVGPEVVGQVVSDWTGVPVGSMVRDEADSIRRLGENLRRRIKGQDAAIAAIEEGIRAAKVGIGNPNAPMGVFLLVGSSGVGKTETATAVADLLFGGERFLISINMSEFQERHTISRLVGSPPGYVGYGEGGVLTEAVRQRPYSVVLLDEVEKADLEVLNLFYQVFDKGTLSDGEGRVVDFRNTVVFLASNLATDLLTELGAAEPRPTAEEAAEAIRPLLSRHFKPALLGRMQVVPFFPLAADSLGEIVRIKLDRVGRRLQDSRRIAFRYTDAVVEAIAARCTDVDSGARNIDHIVGRTLLPRLSDALLARMAEDVPVSSVSVALADDGTFTLEFGDGP